MCGCVMCILGTFNLGYVEVVRIMYTDNENDCICVKVNYASMYGYKRYVFRYMCGLLM